MGLRYVSLFVLVLAVTQQNAHGFADSVKSKLLEYIQPLVMECAKEMDFTEEMIEEMKEKGKIVDKPCLIACYFKKGGVLDGDGMFLVEEARKIVKEVLEGESPEDLVEFDNMALKCASVNDEKVGDSEEGCDRALLLHKCFNM